MRPRLIQFVEADRAMSAPVRAPDATIFHGRHLQVNFADESVCVDGAPIALTKRQLSLLCALVERCNQTLSRDALLARVWGSHAWDCRVVDSAVWKLRRKLRAAASQIETIVGFGYRFNEQLVYEVQPIESGGGEAPRKTFRRSLAGWPLRR